MGSGVFNRVWPLAKARGAKLVTPHFLSAAEFGFAFVRCSFKGAERLKHAARSASVLRLKAWQNKRCEIDVAPKKSKGPPLDELTLRNFFAPSALWK